MRPNMNQWGRLSRDSCVRVFSPAEEGESANNGFAFFREVVSLG